MLKRYHCAEDTLIEGMELLFKRLDEMEEHMSAELDALTAKVTEVIGIEQSAIALIQGFAERLQVLADELAAAGIDNTKVVELMNDLDTSSDALAAAVAANTP